VLSTLGEQSDYFAHQADVNGGPDPSVLDCLGLVYSGDLHHALEATWTFAGLRTCRSDNSASVGLSISDKRF
jgi:hypothetical protein